MQSSSNSETTGKYSPYATYAIVCRFMLFILIRFHLWCFASMVLALFLSKTHNALLIQPSLYFKSPFQAEKTIAGVTPYHYRICFKERSDCFIFQRTVPPGRASFVIEIVLRRIPAPSERVQDIPYK